MHNKIKSACVYCGSKTGARPVYEDVTSRLGKIMAESGIRLIYGGGSIGLMGNLAHSVLNHGGKVTGIIPRFLDKAEVGLRQVDDFILTDNMHERKQKMVELADAFIILPGGLGTLDETFEVLTWKQLGLHDKPILLLNIDNYWDHLVHLIEHQVREDFVGSDHLSLFKVVSSAEDALVTLLSSS